MNIWLITSGEIIPLNKERAFRIGILSTRLANAGHQVTWWTTTFDHQSKTFLYGENTENQGMDGVIMIYLHARIGYKKNISLQRIRNHKMVSNSFCALAKEKEKPDLIFCSFPTIDLSYEAVKYGNKNDVPVIIDVRDLWPDFFFNPFPKWMHPVIKLVLYNYIKKTKYLFNHCNAITAISEGYLNWAFGYCKRQRNAADKVFPLGYERDANTVTFNNYAEYFSEKGLDASKITVWFVGTFGQTYDLTTVIKAARELESKDLKDMQFVFTGDGEKMAEWLALASGLENVVFTGWANKEQLNYLSGIADIGLMAYSSNAPQGLPNKLFEYMSGGFPILSSLKGETEEIINKYSIGLSYDADDTKSLLVKLQILANDTELRRQMGENGIKVFEREYASGIVYGKLVEYIENQVRK